MMEGRESNMDRIDITEAGLEQRATMRDEAKDQARSVADSAKREAKSVFSQIGNDLSAETQGQKLRLAKSLDGFSAELEEVALNGSGRVPALASEAATRTRSFSRWLEQTDPRDMVRMVEDFARRRPLAFVLTSAGAGLVAGRLTRGMIDAGSGSDPARALPAATTPSSIGPIGGPGGAVPSIHDSEWDPTPTPATASVGSGEGSAYGGVS
jgi:ElaB/YqjD/DUF883 family membrane-anchored ribosome-binding protein